MLRLAQTCRRWTGSLSVLQQQYAWQHQHADQHVGGTTDVQQQFSSLWPVQQQHHFSSQLPQQHQLQQQQQQQQSGQQPQPHQRSMAALKLYTGNWILPVRFLVRAKVFQLVGGGSIGLLLGSLALTDEVSFLDIFALTALAGGMVAASCCLWYYSRRYVGEMSLMMPDAQRVRFSVLDFWGNREDVVVPVEAMKPPFKGIRKKEMERLANQIFFPITVQGDRQYYVSIHAGKLLEPQVFLSMLKGEYSPQDHPPVIYAQEFWREKLQQQAAVLQQQLEQQQHSSAE